MSDDIRELVEKRERERRIKLRQEKDRQKKEMQRRYYIVGELFCIFFPSVNSLSPGTKEENDIIFQPLIQFLTEISTNPDVVSILDERL